mgnify:CR=1 FL=1
MQCHICEVIVFLCLLFIDMEVFLLGVFCYWWWQSNPTLFAVSTTKGVQDISIPHSLRWRQRDAPRGEKLLDEEASTWEEAFHRFDDRDSDSNIQRGCLFPARV